MTYVKAPMIPRPVIPMTRELAAKREVLEKTFHSMGLYILHLGAGYPNPEVTDPSSYKPRSDAYFKHLAERRSIPMSRLLTDMYGYTDTMGPVEPRKAFAHVYGADFGVDMHFGDLVPSLGASGGMDLMCRLFESTGERIAYIVDKPTYNGFVARAQSHKGSSLFSVEMDQEGPIPESLDRAVCRAREKGYFVAFYYTIPDGHNPMGISFSQKRREEIYRIAQNREFLITEDGAYNYIYYGTREKRPKPFMSMDPDKRVVHLFTASKIGFPGPRVGFVYAPGSLEIENGAVVPLTKLLSTASATSILMHNPESLRIFEAYLHDEAFNLRSSLWPIADEKLQVYRENKIILMEGLTEFLGDHPDLFHWTVPEAGFFSVVTFLQGPHGTPVDSIKLAEWLLDKHQVTSVPMASYYTSDPDSTETTQGPTPGSNQLRLAFSYTEGIGDDRRRQMREAVVAFGKGIRERWGLKPI